MTRTTDSEDFLRLVAMSRAISPGSFRFLRSMHMQSINESAAKAMAEAAKDFQAALEKIQQTAVVVRELQKAGVVVKLGHYSLLWGDIDVQRSDLVSARKALGRLKMTEKSVAGNASKGQVAIILQAEAYPLVGLRYYSDLPKNSKCKIVENSSTYRSLVCSA
jgi:hypothetical protein